MLLLSATSADAGSVMSAEVKAVSVTLYRDPGRSAGAMNAKWPGGYALITETRTITIPAGDSVIRFEGVAEGMLPETAIVTGLPKGVREKNRDARLISPAGLVDAYLARSVHLRRTSRATGKVMEQDGIIRAGPYGGVVLETSAGIEALGCAGLPERMLFDGVPEGLSARPTLSVLTNADRAVTATVQLSYLAQGFDWSANYVAQVADDGKTLDLFAWATIANGGSQGFVAASTQAVAGQPNKVANRTPPSAPQAELRLQCWPMDNTSTHPSWGLMAFPPPPPAPGMIAYESMSDIVVTAQKREDRMMMAMAPVAMTAVQEDLGDLKLYRIPEPVTIAAQSQKQVAMINQRGVKFERIYTASVDGAAGESRGLSFLLRTKNVKERGLGLALPAGGLILFEPVDGQMILAGQDDVTDQAIGDEVEYKVGESADVRYLVKQVVDQERSKGFSVTVTSARSVPVTAEILIPYELSNKPTGLVRKNGGWMWRATIPPNGTAVLRYRLKLRPGR